MHSDASTEQLPHPVDLWQRLIPTYYISTTPELPRLPFSRFRAFSQVTCTSLFSFASHRSIFNVAAYSSHRFLLNTKLTTGNKLFFLR